MVGFQKSKDDVEQQALSHSKRNQLLHFDRRCVFLVLDCLHVLLEVCRYGGRGWKFKVSSRLDQASLNLKVTRDFYLFSSTTPYVLPMKRLFHPLSMVSMLASVREC